MGRSARSKPLHLGVKLLKIRNSLGISQDQMLARLGLAEGHYRSAIS